MKKPLFKTILESTESPSGALQISFNVFEIDPHTGEPKRKLTPAEMDSFPVDDHPALAFSFETIERLTTWLDKIRPATKTEN